jgi:molybdopterin-guanine dinucleotide biosynthesis protein A
MSVTGIVLAGGRATRFGGPKLAAEIEGVSILSRAIGSISSLADEIIIAGPEMPEPVPGQPESLHLLPDAEPFGGPLAALDGALAVARGDVALVVGGDMPSLVPAVLEAMIARLVDDLSIDAVLLGLPEAAGRTGIERPQVLPLVCRVEAARAAASVSVLAGDRSLRALLGRLAHAELRDVTWRGVDPDARTLLDVDTPTDLERIRRHET